MRLFKRFYKFLGSIRFAITLIGAVTIFVIAGTLIESITGSHRFAVHYTYGNPIFGLLLWGFFVNILFSALQRWPFKLRHIPFLITHLGLLMLLSGAIIKNSWGIQGSMGIIEGSASQEIFLPDTYVIEIEKKGDDNKIVKMQYELIPNIKGRIHDSSRNFPELAIKLLDYTPHSLERFDIWIKDGYGFISGIRPFEILEEIGLDKTAPLPIAATAKLHPLSIPWNIMAFQSDNIEELARKIYLQGLTIQVHDNVTNHNLFQGTLEEILKSPIIWKEGRAIFDLQFDYSQILGFTEPKLIVDISYLKDSLEKEKISIPLAGSDSLINQNVLKPYLGSPSLEIDLFRTPVLAFIQDLQNDVYLFAYDAHGQVYDESFRPDNLNSLISYDDGFGGYYVQAKLPFPCFSCSRKDKESADLVYLSKHLRSSLEDKPILSPPLEVLKNACEKTDSDFVESCLAFLYQWDKRGGWLFPEKQPLTGEIKNVISSLDLESISLKEKKAAYWISRILPEIEKQLRQEKDLLEILSDRGWPILEELRNFKSGIKCTPEETGVILLALCRQIFAVAEELPEVNLKDPLSDEKKAVLFSAYLRAYNIHLQNIIPPADDQQRKERLIAYHGVSDTSNEIILETPLTINHHSLMPLKKLEDNLPKITLLLAEGKTQEKITLAYDRYGTGLHWPAIKGKYLLRFQPKFQKIPYRIRLRDARQINYANSSQPYSFESDLIITDGLRSIEKTISMNNVHETWDGYRFYLANISPPNENSVQRIQIVVNHDPAKYYLTYPGAILIAIGIILLFSIGVIKNT